ncbi:MAG: toprim domain-containing protein [Bacteroidetes bacterium]|nr:toprim domain-containing protein [Bacteroidota bacterium]
MNIAQARDISIVEILQNLGYEHISTNGKESWYLSPFRSENSASFKLNLKLNRWYDHGEQIGGNVVDLIVKLKKFTVSEALKYLQSCDTFSFQKQAAIAYERKKEGDCNNVLIVKRIEHSALKQYLVSRGITDSYALMQIEEVHYEINQKKYFAIGFKNKSDGWELRSKYAKICLGKKDITLINNGCTVVKIFEGFFDYLSFLQISDEKNVNESDYLILNSAALVVKNISILEKYKVIELYLDNDSTGDKYTKLITARLPAAKDERFKYSECKDLNEYLCKYKPI